MPAKLLGLSEICGTSVEAETDRMASKRANRWRLNSFFSGVGGFELAFERNRFSSGFYCENDLFCRSVLKRHWPDTPSASDIRRLDASLIPSATVWTAGFPCQDLSLAKAPHGRTGFRGTKSSLFFTFHELLRSHRPKVVLLENVAGLLNSHQGADFEALLKALTDLGYAVAWRLLNARYFGVPQSRPRVFICAWMSDPVRAVSSLFEKQLAPSPKRERDGFITPSHCPITGAIVPLVSYCISATSARHTGLDWARSYVTYYDAVRRLTPLECERIQGFPDQWSLPGNSWVTPIDGVDTERYRAIGNAIALPLVEWIAKRLLSNLESDVAQVRPLSLFGNPMLAEHLGLVAGEFSRAETHALLLEEGRGEHKWQRGGCAYQGEVVQTPASTAPYRCIPSRFVDLIEKRQVPARYFLSSNAAQGIIRRVERAERHLFPPLESSLRALALGDVSGPKYARKIAP